MFPALHIGIMQKLNHWRRRSGQKSLKKCEFYPSKIRPNFYFYFWLVDAFFCDLNISLPGYVPQNHNFSKNKKIFFGKIALNLYQKISKTKGNSFEQKIPPPPGIRTPDRQLLSIWGTYAGGGGEGVVQRNCLWFLRFFGTNSRQFFQRNFFVFEKLWFWGTYPGGEMFRSQKKASENFL